MKSCSHTCAEANEAATRRAAILAADLALLGWWSACCHILIQGKKNRIFSGVVCNRVSMSDG